MSLLERDIKRMSYFVLIEMQVTQPVRSVVVDHLRVSYSRYNPPMLFTSSLRVHRQNLPKLLPKMNPFENAHIAVTVIL